MTVLELQKELKKIYEKYGDIEVVTKEPDWRYSECLVLSLLFLLWRIISWQRKTDEKICRLFRNQRTIVSYSKRNKTHNEFVERLYNELLNEIKELKEIKL